MCAPREIAKKLHSGQKYGEYDYVDYHLAGVVRNLITNHEIYLPSDYAWEANKDFLIGGCWLHDTYEDCDQETVMEAIKGLPQRIQRYCFQMAKDDTASYYEYIMYLCNYGDPGLIAIKLADLDFNIAESRMEPLSKYKEQRLNKYLLARHILLEKNK